MPKLKVHILTRYKSLTIPWGTCNVLNPKPEQPKMHLQKTITACNVSQWRTMLLLYCVYPVPAYYDRSSLRQANIYIQSKCVICHSVVYTIATDKYKKAGDVYLGITVVTRICQQMI